MDMLKIFRSILLIVGVVVLCYANVLNNDFLLYDDVANVLENPKVMDINASLATRNPKDLAFALIYKFYEFNPSAYHAHSLIIHIINSILVYLIVRSLLKEKEFTGIIITLFFAINPVVGETVNWVAGSIYLYNALFVFLVLLFFIHFHATKNKVYFFISLIIYSISLYLLGNPWLLVVPPIIIALDYFYWGNNKKIDFYSYGIFVLIAVVYIFSMMTNLYGKRIERLTEAQVLADSPSRILMIGKNIWSTFGTLVFPFNVSVVHNPIRSEFSFSIIYLSAYPLLFFILFRLYKRNKKLFSLLLLYFVSVLPIFSPKDIAVNYAERYFYVASMFGALIYFYLLSGLSKKNFYTLSSFLLVVFLILSVIRTFDWKNDESIWTHALKVAPLNYKPYLELGIIAHKEDRLRDALEYYDKALKLSGTNDILQYNIGMTYLKAGAYDYASQYFGNTLKINKNFKEAYYRLGQIEAAKGNKSAAEKLFNIALQLDPSYAPALTELELLK